MIKGMSCLECGEFKSMDNFTVDFPGCCISCCYDLLCGDEE